METVRCIFHADMGHGSGSPFPPGSGAASACSLVAQHKVYTHGRSERHFPQVFTSGRNILAVHRIGERVQQNERTVGFYADKLCLTPRYLNTLIRQVSHQTVMEWINQSVILEAKVLLKHSNLLVYQISDELHFPNPSFFCKFFKRMTGMTPQEYQKR